MKFRFVVYLLDFKENREWIRDFGISVWTGEAVVTKICTSMVS